MRRRALLLVVLAAASVLVRGSAAWACVCPPEVLAHERAAVQSGVKTSHAVFGGTAVSIVPVEETVRVTFAVRDVYKGAVSSPYVVTTPEVDSCGIDFVAGKDYDVLVKLKDRIPTTELCSGTDAAGFLKRAGIPVKMTYPAGTVTQAAAEPQDDDPRGARAGAIGAASLLLALIAGYYVMRARARRGTGGGAGLPR